MQEAAASKANWLIIVKERKYIGGSEQAARGGGGFGEQQLASGSVQVVSFPDRKTDVEMPRADLCRWFFWTSASSIAVSPNSFSMIAIFLPCVAVRM